ncbi:MAG TPA: hypothetical protein VJX67_04820 [Blastocatellia bacterium]|nr:hypothetical protein [Blastocatellia bacterium]
MSKNIRDVNDAPGAVEPVQANLAVTAMPAPQPLAEASLPEPGNSALRTVRATNVSNTLLTLKPDGRHFKPGETADIPIEDYFRFKEVGDRTRHALVTRSL